MPPARPGPWNPPWVASLGVAVWVRNPSGRLSYLNRRAADLLGEPTARRLGRPCHIVISGKDADGRPFCAPECPLVRLARDDQAIEPFRLLLGRPHAPDHWVQVQAVTVWTPDRASPWIVHCVQGIPDGSRLEDYLARVASRTNAFGAKSARGKRRPLSRREAEVLRLLAEDETPHGIALRLGISHATVRNHIQHVLEKMGTHSTMEAVVRHLLMKG